jgi:hypothetical protein
MANVFGWKLSRREHAAEWLAPPEMMFATGSMVSLEIAVEWGQGRWFIDGAAKLHGASQICSRSWPMRWWRHMPAFYLGAHDNDTLPSQQGYVVGLRQHTPLELTREA